MKWSLKQCLQTIISLTERPVFSGEIIRVDEDFAHVSLKHFSDVNLNTGNMLHKMPWIIRNFTDTSEIPNIRRLIKHKHAKLTSKSTAEKVKEMNESNTNKQKSAKAT